ncbi:MULTISPECIES: phosphoenolpyruvate carboxylase [Metallosphaera]|uniref:phosphoenolpyruvate carboxylase n=1 Tax=Metallosphaera TaxID=41980 RepID=UPI001F0704BD|nr:phosphoenolpyruvate carboxylase [Metallosphaera sedula]MCH1771757.1 phosphoenolpyruvate carboxylase [Metallosphaera sedula]MCP6728355.1 phosphoenolpyruvate carboxylase [Metallosphaera sedula]
MRPIPRTMSTQHPDNATVPEWAKGDVIEGEAEVIEAYYAFSRLNVHEVMWDAEGKDVDTHVVRKLFSSFDEYFKSNVLGEDIFLTYRLPNPKIEGAERKVFAETMESIPITFDVAERFYGKKVVPVFEVILPFTTNASDIISVARYYERAVAMEENIELQDGVYVRDLVGEIYPKRIEVIPLIEDKDSLLNTRNIIEGYYRAIKPSYMRLFIARSDPAMNYGMLTAVLLAKYALSEAGKLAEELGIPIFPIIGVGSLPFRGHLSPENYQRVMEEYEGVYTFTIQSAFKYDYSEEQVKGAISHINREEVKEPRILGEEEKKVIRDIIETYTLSYQPVIESLANLINTVALHLPRRRARKLHISLFGYARSTGKVILPRAITFVGSLYSVGLPPEVIGISSLSKLNETQWNILEENYKFLKNDLQKASEFINPEGLSTLVSYGYLDAEISKKLEEDIKYLESMGVKIGPRSYESKKHALLSQLLMLSLKEKKYNEVKQYAREMAVIRKSIG